MTYRLTTDVFCLDHLDGYIAYAPLKGQLLMVNRAAADLLATLHGENGCEPDERNLEAMSILMDLGLVNGSPDEIHQGRRRLVPADGDHVVPRAIAASAVSTAMLRGGSGPASCPGRWRKRPSIS